MKIKLCSKCGKQNDENAWNCVDCGATLSINTLIDEKDLGSKQIEFAYQHTLGDISPYFQEDVLTNFFQSIESGEGIIRGFDICLLSPSAPFWIGYLVVTSQRLISVYFEVDTHYRLTEGIIPQRSFSRFGTRQDREIMVDRLDSPLTSEEKSSRNSIIFSLRDLSSIELVRDVDMNMKFRKEDGISLIAYSTRFYFSNDAYEIYSLLNKLLKNKSGE